MIPGDDEYIPVVPIQDLPSGERVILEVDDQEIIILHIGEACYAIAGICTHEKQSLAEGTLEDFSLTCPKHGARFDVRDGTALTLPAVVRLKTYSTRINKGMIEIKL